jgi:2-polyprenyl-6-methoxyphenol hydroxylase-like FAD-dependent oxidoreductase
MTLVKYHKHADALPRNFIALGDAWLRLNPINGQGMAKAALEAATLDATLRSASHRRGEPLDVATSFYKRIAPRLLRTWAQQKAADYKLETTEPAQGELREQSQAGLMSTLISGFTTGVGKRLLAGDRDVAARAMGVSAWVCPPTDLFAPSVVGKILFDKALGRW